MSTRNQNFFRRAIVLVVAVAVAGTAAASPAGDGVTADDVFDAYPFLDGKSVPDVTVNDLLAVAEQVSVQRQEHAYVMHAAGASMMVPGGGQFVVGETGRGIAHLTAGLAIAGGAATGAWFLLPDELTSILGDSSEVKTYFEDWQPDLLPAAGVIAGGTLLYTINTIWSARAAARSASDQIASGDVVFEPNLAIVGAGFGLGGRIRY